MKHKIFSFVLCLCIALSLSLTAQATFQDIQYVVDQADLLTDSENIELNAIARELSQVYGIDVLIAVVEDLNENSADEYSVSLNSGHWWDSDDSILFVLAMEEREWYISTYGKAIQIFTDYGLDQLGKHAVNFFSEGNYCEGFSTYLSMLPDYFEAYRNGTPIDGIPAQKNAVFVPRESLWDVLPSSLLTGIIAAAVSILIMRYSMNTKRRQHNAGNYLTQETYQLHTQRDIFLYSNTSKTRRQENSGGGSTVHRRSGGRSHGGRGGKF